MRADERSEAEVAQLRRVIEAVIGREVPDPVAAEELGQDALVRVIRARPRIDDAGLVAYATAVARNTVRNYHRAERSRRNKDARAAAASGAAIPAVDEAPPMPDPTEAAAVHAGLAGLAPSDRDLLTAIDVDDATIAEVARRHDLREGALRVRLLRARARLRTRYLIALRRAELPTPRCLPVLDALSAGDRARQRSLSVSDHLATCPTCASLAEPLLTRRRPLAVLPVPAIVAWRWLRHHPRQAATGAVIASAVLAAAVGTWAPQRQAAAPPAATTSARQPSPLRTPARNILPVPADLSASVGEPVVAESVPVEEVVGDEAFWIGTSPTDRVLVILTGGTESTATITVGQRVSFTGRLSAVTPDVAAEAGIDENEGAGLLTTQGAYIPVAEDTITITA